MGRSTRPLLLGIVKDAQKGSGEFVTVLWALDGGHTRVTRIRAFYEGKLTQQGERLIQLPLLDRDGNRI